MSETNQNIETAMFPPLDRSYRKTSRRQILCLLSAYAILCLSMVVLQSFTESMGLRAIALGMSFPGMGFLYWAGPDNSELAFGVICAAASVLALLFSLFVWFATGNILLPIIVWMVSALIAGLPLVQLRYIRGNPVWDFALPAVLSVIISTTILLLTLSYYLHRRGNKTRQGLNEYLNSLQPRPARPVENRPQELSLDQLQHMRLLLDRALQPIDQFEGFEWIDQFQTAAVRYQLNFTSYALSMAQSVFLPDFHGYLTEAQENLAIKQTDKRIWDYWRLENWWGNLRSDADPIKKDNIMYSGFVAAQIALYQKASGNRRFSPPDSFTLNDHDAIQYKYSLPKIISVLTAQYRSYRYGLLPCEPNWIYPLCNFITASAIRASDMLEHRENTASIWPSIEDMFRQHLETEFTREDGQLVPFRSSYTGLAPPPIGGIVMQAFPCLFLNATLPDIAERQWAIFRKSIKGRDLRKACWPIDVGNYGFSRASSYAATAAAAREFGDDPLADEMLQYLDTDCPRQLCEGVYHRNKASLWAHAVEFMAHCGVNNGFQQFVVSPIPGKKTSPFIKNVAYPDILVARAVSNNDQLSCVFHPGDIPVTSEITIGGLKPHHPYVARSHTELRFKADKKGEANLNLFISGRSEFNIVSTGQ